MQKIGVISDTHGYAGKSVLDFFSGCNEIWHAGDIGNKELAEKFEQFKTFRAVYGNIDDHHIRIRYPEHLFFYCETTKILITHIGGYPGKYDRKALSLIHEYKPDLFICGHSHILKVQYDNNMKMLYINPGAGGKYGFHHKRTAVRFSITENKIHELEVLETNR